MSASSRSIRMSISRWTLSHADLSRQSRPGPERADYGAERRDLRHRDRGEQSGIEIEAGNDGQCFDHHRARDNVLKIAMRRCVIVRRMSREPSRTPAPGRRAAAGGRRWRTHGVDERSRADSLCFARAANPTPVQIKTGISDGVTTEVLEGLKEGDRVVTAAAERRTTRRPDRRPNPFSGGGPRRF